MLEFTPIKFLQQPRYITIPINGESILIPQQPTTWEFQESADYENWFNVIDIGGAYHKVPCEPYTGVAIPGGVPEEYDQNSLCHYTIKWLDAESNWVRARSVQEVTYWSHENYSFEVAVSHSEWSEPLSVITAPEPSGSLLLMAGIMMLALLSRWRRRGLLA